jgi:hypothetical protein
MAGVLDAFHFHKDAKNRIILFIGKLFVKDIDIKEYKGTMIEEWNLSELSELS